MNSSAAGRRGGVLGLGRTAALAGVVFSQLAAGGLPARAAPEGASPAEERGDGAGGREASERAARRAAAAEGRQQRHAAAKVEAWAAARRQGWEPSWTRGGVVQELEAIRDGRVYVYCTFNANAAISTAASAIRDAAPYNLSGAGVRIGVWDVGEVRRTHRELTGRVTVYDIVGVHFHSTHVGGTLAASGVTVTAKGMAPAALLESFDWNADTAEMTVRGMSTPGQAGMIPLSNHSYGYTAGWSSTTSPPRWYGTWGAGIRESDLFGIYDEVVAEWDSVCHEAPYYLPFVAAGNDRSDAAPSSGASFEYFDPADMLWKTKAYSAATDPYADGWDQGGYDTITVIGNAKNIVTVGAVQDAVSGGVRSVASAGMLAFSGWGPADDGRVKPDLVANGDSLYSSYSSSDSAYATMSGTSMATPNAAGSAALLWHYYGSLFPGQSMRSSTLKGLILHTADDLGNAGPDYRFGWGLMNVRKAADILREHASYPEAIRLREDALGPAVSTRSYPVLWDGRSPLRVTLCWTDPPGAPAAGLDVRSPKLVNDLDLRLVAPSGQTNFPYVIDVLHPTVAAATGDNDVDNVEQVYLAAPLETGTYAVVVSTEGPLHTTDQWFSLVVSGSTAPPAIEHEPLGDTTQTSGVYEVDAAIHSINGLKPNGATVSWWTQGAASGAGSNVLVAVSNGVFRGEIPAQPVGTTVHYYLQAVATNGLASTHPDGAPAVSHSFVVRPPALLVVLGSPAEYGEASPPYGMNAFPSGATVRASAGPHDLFAVDSRHSCTGWRGMGSVPAEGATNAVSFALARTSALEWQWALQHRLLQESSVTGILDVQTWWLSGRTGATVLAAASSSVSGQAYRFAEWRVAGVRRQDARGVAVNPAGGIAMAAPVQASALYLEEDADGDGDGMPDWWERLFFGDAGALPLDDPDWDGYLNLEEYEDRSDPLDDESVPAPPVIVYGDVPDPQVAPAPWTISAVITDNFEVASATLRWRRNTLTWRQAAMAPVDPPGHYVGVIPEPGILRDSFQYSIQAADPAGYLAQGETRSFSVAYPVAAVEPRRVDVLLRAGATTNVALTLGNTGNADLSWHAEVADAERGYDMESGDAGWAHGGIRDMWHLSTRRAVSGQHSWYCGDEGTGLYQNSMDARLAMPPVTLGHGARLRFQHWPNFEASVAGYTWDGAVVEISTNGGGTYARITPVGGYPYLIESNPASPFAAGTRVFGGSGTWREAEFDLSAYAERQVVIRFRAGTDAYVTDEGWFLDDISIGPLAATADWLTVAPPGGALPVSSQCAPVLVFDSAKVPTGTDNAMVVSVVSDDPINPVVRVDAAMLVRSAPAVELPWAAQTSADGSGVVTATNLVYDADGDPCDVRVEFSTDGGGSWTGAWVRAAAPRFGAVTVTNGPGAQILGVDTVDGADAATNRVAVSWATTNGPSPVALSTNTTLRVRAWDGLFWSAAATSAVFLVDNEPPGPPGAITSVTHAIGTWSTNARVEVRWPPASDGHGGGVAFYRVLFTNAPPARAEGGAGVTNPAATSAPLADGSNWWVAAQAMDIFGNIGPAASSGPYWIDSHPPDASGAVVSIATSPFGAYVIGPALVFEWTGFEDWMSGIAGYLYGFEDGGGTANGVATTAGWGGLTGAVANATNRVYVWAVDRAGLIGPAAQGSVLVLDESGDRDGDGVSNAGEEVAGSDAVDPASVFGFVAAAGAAGTNGVEVLIQWSTVTGRLYSLYRRESLADGYAWEPVPGAIDMTGTGSPMSYRDQAGGVRVRFYRVAVRLP